MGDLISRQAAIDAIRKHEIDLPVYAPRETDVFWDDAIDCCIGELEQLPSAQPEIIRCKECKWWRQQTNYQGTPLSFGFCESDDMWQSLYGETYEVEHIDTDDDFYCGYAVRGNRDES